MKYPNFKEEKELQKAGYRQVAGLDEAGRGPLAGPVVAAAVFVNPDSKIENLKIRDSKKLSKKQREFFYSVLTSHKDIQWGIGIVSEKVIDKVNILEATKSAMEEALKDSGVISDFLILDGNFKINSEIPQKPVVAGDAKVFSCCAAGIIAKVTRDKLMEEYHKKYPKYAFERHKGYGTALHIKNLKRFGPCKIHRKTFFPVSES